MTMYGAQYEPQFKCKSQTKFIFQLFSNVIHLDKIEAIHSFIEKLKLIQLFSIKDTIELSTRRFLTQIWSQAVTLYRYIYYEIEVSYASVNTVYSEEIEVNVIICPYVCETFKDLAQFLI